MMSAVIFDIDGTLVDTVDMHAEAWQRAFRAYGKDLDFATVRAQIGKGGDQLMPVFLSPAELAAFGEALEHRRSALFKQEYLPHARAFPQVRALVERLKVDGTKIALASSASKEELAYYTQLTGLTDVLDGATSAEDAAASKPAPDIFAAALAQLGHPAPQETLVIGDSPYDAMAAAQLGLRTIGLLCGGFPAQRLQDAGCIALYHDPADLLAQYDTWVLGQGGPTGEPPREPLSV
jgi:HAD superfamily hydrolase (TIGR01509 family)